MSTGENSAGDDNNVTIATWPLKNPEWQEDVGMTLLHYENEGQEVAVPDGQKVVTHLDITPEGKYPSIVKLFMRYEGNRELEAMGTGWLIAPDLLVTAGHCAYDWSQNLHKAVQIRAYMGYNGKNSIITPNNEYRWGIRVATTVKWLNQKGSNSGDFSVIKLNAPFPTIRPFKYSDTPLADDRILGVVGYPGDKSYLGEMGGPMYEMFQVTKYNRGDGSDNGHMLNYTASTYAGQSGSPVLVEGAQGYNSIGIHTYSGAGNNLATPIGNATTFGVHVRTYHEFCARNMWESTRRKIDRPTDLSDVVGKDIEFYSIPMQESIV